jgi:excisionase family DNA binding protein
MDKQFYTVTDIRDILTIGTNKAYNLIKSDGFPSIKIGRKYLVPKDEFEKWVKTYLYHEFLL